MIDGVKDLTPRVHQTIAQLQQEFPEDGFILVGMRAVGGRTVVTLASNIDEDDLSNVLEDIISGEDLGEVPIAKMHN